jgi:hypothetical protein
MIVMKNGAPCRRNTDTSAARLANRVRYARERHAKWLKELRAWGYEVKEPEALIPPSS